MLFVFQPKLQLSFATAVKALNPSSDQPPCYGHGCARTADGSGGENSQQQKILKAASGSPGLRPSKIKDISTDHVQYSNFLFKGLASYVYSPRKNWAWK